MAIFNWKPKLVLPTVYDDALSYQEILGKVVDELNRMGETGKLVNAVFPNENPVISIRDNGINIVGKAKIVYMDGTEKDCDIDMTIPLAKGDNVNFAVVDGVVKIFATDTTYTGGNGIVLEGTVVKVNYDEVQRKLTAGTGIVIQEATISVDTSIYDRITVVEDAANTANSNATAAQAAANAAQATANAAQTAANDASGVAESARTTANTAQTTANDASGVAESARTTANAAQATANDASEVATSARSTANTAKADAEQASTKADEAKTQAANALQTADAAQAAATLAQNRADSAYNLANTADIATQQNASRIQIIEDTTPQFSLTGTTLTITLPA